MEPILFFFIIFHSFSPIILADEKINLNTSASNAIALSQGPVHIVTTGTQVPSVKTSQPEDLMLSHSTTTLQTSHSPSITASSIFSRATSFASSHKSLSTKLSVIVTSPSFTTPDLYSGTTAPGNNATVMVPENNTTVGVSTFSKISDPSVQPNWTDVTVTPSLAPDNSLTLLAFGVMSLILVLIVIMVILVTTINLRGKCRSVKKQEGIKSYNSVSDSNLHGICEKESITLVSVRSINAERDSPQVSSVHSTVVDNEDQELNKDLLAIKESL